MEVPVRQVLSTRVHASIVLSALLAFAPPAATPAADAATRRVPIDYPTIQAALNAAVNGDVVVIEPGVYTEHLVFPPRGITLRSDSGNPLDTILDGGSPTPDSPGPPLIFVIPNGSREQVIEGITLRRASQMVLVDPALAPHNVILRSCHFLEANSASAVALGIGRMTVLDCLFERNISPASGAAIRSGGQLRVERTLFENNATEDASDPNLGRGGAIAAGRESGRSILELYDCTFQGNRSSGTGGAVFVTDSDLLIAGCRFLDNLATSGGGLFVQAADAPRVENCLFDRNEASTGAGLCFFESVTLSLVRNTVVDSRGFGQAQGILLVNSSYLAVQDNIVAGGSGVGIEAAGGFGLIECNNAYANAGGNIVAGAMITLGLNLSADPQFCAAAAGDYTLSEASPCAPANSPCGRQIGAFPASCVPVTVEGATWSRIKLLPGR
jgi:predicted outer membrane repeat protein